MPVCVDNGLVVATTSSTTRLDQNQKLSASCRHTKSYKEIAMDIPADWTLLDETLVLYVRTLEHELRRTHGVLFTATFLDEFEPEIRKIASRSLIRQRPGSLPPA